MRMMSYVAIALASLSPVAAFAQPAAPISENSLYIYRANVVDVHDANSITVDVDLGEKNVRWVPEADVAVSRVPLLHRA